MKPGRERNDPDYVLTRCQRIVLTEERLLNLIVQAKRKRLSPRCVGLLHSLVTMSPKVRLVVNIKVILGLMAQQEVRNILTEGFTRNEREALVELDKANLPVDVRETAHALLNIDERLRVVKLLAGAFRRLRAAHGQALTDEQIEGIINGHD